MKYPCCVCGRKMYKPYFEYDSEFYCRADMPTFSPSHGKGPSRRKGAVTTCVGCGRDIQSSSGLCIECRGLSGFKHHRESLDRSALPSLLFGYQPSTGEGSFEDYIDTDNPEQTEETS